MVEYIFGIGAAYFAAKCAKRIFYSKVMPKIKGNIGEGITNRELSKLSNSKYKVYKDLLLPTDRDTTQLDQLVVSPYGLFVIETKNYSGEVFGMEWDNQWFQMTNNKSTPIHNPVRQNFKHVRALEYNLSGLGKIPIYPIVAISNKCRMNVVSEGTSVIHQRDIVSSIKRLSGQEVLSDAQLKLIESILDKSNIVDKSQRRAHVKAIRKNKEYNLPDLLADAVREGKNSPIIHFSRQPTKQEREFAKKLEHFKCIGPMLTIRGRTDNLDGFMTNARRNADDTVADKNKPCHHIICPFSGAEIPATEASNLQRGLLIKYFKDNPDMEEYARSNDGFKNLYPEKTDQSVLAAAYLKSPANFIAQAKQSVWFQIMQGKTHKKERINLDNQIQSASHGHSFNQREQQRTRTQEFECRC